MSLDLHRAAVADIAPTTLYRILRLRVAVFVVEQQAAYPEIDGRDIEPGAELMWAEDAGKVVSTLRVLVEPDSLRIGRVATAPAARGRGVAAALMGRALERCAELDAARPILLDAQLQLEQWYGRFGFVRAGDTCAEDGIPHVPMRRAATAG